RPHRPPGRRRPGPGQPERGRLGPTRGRGPCGAGAAAAEGVRPTGAAAGGPPGVKRLTPRLHLGEALPGMRQAEQGQPEPMTTHELTMRSTDVERPVKRIVLPGRWQGLAQVRTGAGRA